MCFSSTINRMADGFLHWWKWWRIITGRWLWVYIITAEDRPINSASVHQLCNWCNHWSVCPVLFYFCLVIRMQPVISASQKYHDWVMKTFLRYSRRCLMGYRKDSSAWYLTRYRLRKHESRNRITLRRIQCLIATQHTGRNKVYSCWFHGCRCHQCQGLSRLCGAGCKDGTVVFEKHMAPIPTMEPNWCRKKRCLIWLRLQNHGHHISGDETLWRRQAGSQTNAGSLLTVGEG